MSDETNPTPNAASAHDAARIAKTDLAQAFHVGVCKISRYMRDHGQPMLSAALER